MVVFKRQFKTAFMKPILIVLMFLFFVTNRSNAQIVAVSYSNESKSIPASTRSKSLQIRSVDQFESSKKLQLEINTLKAENAALKDELGKVEGLQQKIRDLQGTIEKLKAAGSLVRTNFRAFISPGEYEDFELYMLK
jgi:FtsZ-binding cell division protein ZapB